eukprot:snap_masked-scaffold_16-processed-gene-2.3-mRNA-1 protein AED:1.00 eAED:1.00 QI:0/0/0/0/1/1/2/0/72
MNTSLKFNNIEALSVTDEDETTEGEEEQLATRPKDKVGGEAQKVMPLKELTMIDGPRIGIPEISGQLPIYFW